MVAKAAKLDTFASPEGSSTPTGNLAAQLQNVDIVNGKLVTVKLTNATTVQYPSHPLNRAYKGAIVIGQSDQSAALTVLRGANLTSGYSPDRVLGLKWLAAPASSSIDVDLWVF